MAFIIKLLIQIIFCWIHGFQTKTGGETWLRRQGMIQNMMFGKGSQRRLF